MPENGLAAPTHASHHAVIPEALVPERRGAIGFLSHVRREGDWILPRLFRVLALMGNVELDLTKVHVGPGTSHIEVKVVDPNAQSWLDRLL